MMIRLTITSASYAPLRNATPSNSRYVTRQLNEWILTHGQGSELRLINCELNTLFGDPCPGERKRLIVKCKCETLPTIDDAVHALPLFLERTWIEGTKNIFIDAKALLAPVAPRSRPTTPEHVTTYHAFPHEVLSVIASFLPVYPDGLGLRIVCKEWNRRVQQAGLTVVYRAAAFPNHPASFVELIVSRSASSLRVFDLAGYGAKLAVLSPVLLQSCQHLRELDLTDCHQLTSEHLLQVPQHCPLLEMLTVKRVPNVKDEFVRASAQHCTKLTRFDLSECAAITDDAIRALVVLPLEALYLNQNHRVSDLGIAGLLVSNQLCELSLRGLHRVSSRSFTSPGLTLVNLLVLNLEGCVQIDDVALDGLLLAAGGRQLVSLDLRHCHRVTDRGVAALCHGASRLQHLNLSHVVRLTDRGLFSIADKLKDLRSLDASFCVALTRLGTVQAATSLPLLSELRLRGCAQLGGDLLVSDLISKGRWIEQVGQLDLRECGCTNQSLFMLRGKVDLAFANDDSAPGCFYR
jgi:hypothetical protein